MRAEPRARSGVGGPGRPRRCPTRFMLTVATFAILSPSTPPSPPSIEMSEYFSVAPDAPPFALPFMLPFRADPGRYSLITVRYDFNICARSRWLLDR